PHEFRLVVDGESAGLESLLADLNMDVLGLLADDDIYALDAELGGTLLGPLTPLLGAALGALLHRFDQHILVVGALDGGDLVVRRADCLLAEHPRLVMHFSRR